MFTLKVSETVWNHCSEQVENYNFGQRRVANGSKDQQLTGVIGQSVVMDLFGFDWIDGTLGFDNGIDMVYNNHKIDIKTMGRTTDVRLSYTNNFLQLQDYLETEIYVFCSYHKLKREVTVCGWIAKKDFVAKRRFYPKGTMRTRYDGTSFETFADLYEIDNQDLNAVATFEELKAAWDGLD
ncbi:hypothetical protein [Flavobacterium restrictum]|uniref:Uncharacterized protein n=1 Tax=Flavobacterium restrictum TaxID=2594428 RepID=A0A553E931_9FLAO|nr:hypothetical protein [Flavobacterium restrictum]TRX41421.1 hypothetical protein FNW21_04800 [Flavobacterium restrictum]